MPARGREHPMSEKMQQMELGTLTRDSRAEYRRKAIAYVQQNREEYLDNVEALCTESETEKLWRLIFAVLTARERFDRARYAYMLLRQQYVWDSHRYNRLLSKERQDVDTTKTTLHRAGLSLVGLKSRGIIYLLDCRNPV